MAAPEGIVAAVHAGWRGLLAGVIERAAEAMRGLGASEIGAFVGACIGPECYEFSAVDLEPIAARLGPSVASRTASGSLALDLRAGVHRALEASAVPVVAEVASCTACEPGWFSWRARAETGRQALVVVPAP
jgi:copper oxidase (laccase) domain-containing protein